MHVWLSFNHLTVLLLDVINFAISDACTTSPSAQNKHYATVSAKAAHFWTAVQQCCTSAAAAESLQWDSKCSALRPTERLLQVVQWLWAILAAWGSSAITPVALFTYRTKPLPNRGLLL